MPHRSLRPQKGSGVRRGPQEEILAERRHRQLVLTMPRKKRGKFASQLNAEKGREAMKRARLERAAAAALQPRAPSHDNKEHATFDSESFDSESFPSVSDSTVRARMM